MQLTCCVVGTSLLITSVILCIVSDNEWLWRSVLVMGEIVAFFGYAPTLLKF